MTRPHSQGVMPPPQDEFVRDMILQPSIKVSPSVIPRFGKLRSNMCQFNMRNCAQMLLQGHIVVLDSSILIFLILRQAIEYSRRFICGERRPWVLASSVEISSDHLESR
jgi:hypothetical protein